MIVRELLTRLGFKVDEAGADKYESRVAAVGKAILAVQATAAVAATAIFTGMNRATDSLVRLKNEANLAGAGLEEFQRFSYAARSVGFETGKVADILKDVNDKVGDFLSTGGGELADYFENIAPLVGQTAEQFRGLSGPQALQLYVDGLQKANLTQAEMKFFMEAIANDATALVPLLADNGKQLNLLADEAAAFGFVTEENVEQAAQYQRQLGQLTAAMDLLRTQIALDLMPVVRDILGEFIEWYKANQAIVQQRLSEALRGIVTVTKAVFDVTKAVVGAFDLFAQSVGGTDKAVRLLLAALGLLVANKAVQALITVVTTLGRIRRALFGIGLVASAAMAVVVASFAAIVVAIEDLWSWFEGKDSVFGRAFGDTAEVTAKVLKEIDEIRQAFIGAVQSLRSSWSAFWRGDFDEALSSAMDGWGDFLTSLLETGDAFAKLVFTPLQYAFEIALIAMERLFPETLEKLKSQWQSVEQWFKSSFDRIGQWFRDLFDFSPPGWITGLFNGPQEGPTSGGRNRGRGGPGAVLATPSAYVPAETAPSVNNSRVSIRNEITVNAEAGVVRDERELARMIRAEFDRSYDDRADMAAYDNPNRENA